MFAKYHYLSHNHNNAAIVYVCFVNNVLAGFISILHTPHPKVKNLKLPANRKKETLFEIFSKHKGTSPEDKDTNQYIEHFWQKFTEEITDFVKKRRKSGELDFKSRAI